MKHNKFGFTLVELLIVIALLGALAVGLLAALDPFEQLKKGTDTGVRNTASEIHGSVIRYYAIKGYMPWCSDAGTCGHLDSTKLSDTSMESMITKIAAAGELKTNFIELATAYADKIYISGEGTSTLDQKVVVCFMPQAKSFRADPNTIYDANGDLHEAAGDCKGHDAIDGDDCYWCIM